jgi:hypothetical protein
MEDKFRCDCCGKETEILLSHRKLMKDLYENQWICEECFKEVHKIGFEDFRLEDHYAS